jgi:Protein of unknown function (DUF2794)
MSLDSYTPTPQSAPQGVPQSASQSAAQAASATVFFERRELDAILRVYGRMVAAGEWRDYALGGGREAAVFAIFRRTSEAPLYRIEKRPALAKRQGAYAVIGAGEVVLRRGHELAQVLKVFDSRKFRLVE